MFLFKGLIIGIIIGGGMILPGVSGGVLAVIFGIYEKMIDAVLNFTSDWKKNTLFLLPIIIGIVIGAIIFGKIIEILFNDYPMESGFVFIGLILGGIPVLFQKIKCHDTGKLNIPLFAIAFIISLLLFVLGKNTLNIDFYDHLSDGYIGQLLLFITGFIYISGKIIPGISASFMLMLIGMYEYTLNIISRPFSLTRYEQLQLIPVILGMIVGFTFLLRLISNLIKEYHNTTYSVIIGFVIGSITAIYPGFSFDYQGLISIILLMVAFNISYVFATRDKGEISLG